MEKVDRFHLKEAMEFCDFYQYPIPKEYVWDGVSSFKRGIAAISRTNIGQDEGVCCVVTYDRYIDREPVIIKSFDSAPVRLDEKGKKIIHLVYVIPDNTYKTAGSVDTQKDLEYIQGNFTDNLEGDVLEVVKINDTVLPTVADKIKKQEFDKFEWALPEISNAKDAIRWLKRNGSTKGLHLIKDDYHLNERIKKVLSLITKKQ